MNLGDQIADIFQKVMDEFRALTTHRPDVATLKPQYEALKERAIQELLPLGRQVAQLAEAERGIVERRVSQRMREMGDASGLRP
jgi:hypothetical protein